MLGGSPTAFTRFDCPDSMEPGDTSQKVYFELHVFNDGGSDCGPLEYADVYLNIDNQDVASVNTGEDLGCYFSIPALEEGTYSVKCVYKGGEQNPSESEIKTITVGGVTPSKTTVYLKNYDGVPSIKMNESEYRTFTAAVYADSMGATPMNGLNLKLTAGPNTLNAVSDANGLATFDLSTVTPGTFTASIGVDSDTYEEDTPLTFALTVIGQKTSVYLTDGGHPTSPITEGDAVSASVIVEDDDGAVSGVNVKLTANDTVLNGVSDSSGTVTFDLSVVPAGTYNVVIAVDDPKYKSTDTVPFTLVVNESAKTSVVITDYPGSVEITEGDAGNFFVFVYDNLQSANPVSGVNVKLNARNTVVRAVSDGMGQASFDLSSVPAGTYTPSVVVDDANYKSNTVTFDLTVNPGTKTNVNLVNIYQLTEIIMYEGQKPLCDFQVLDYGSYEVDGVNVKLTAGSTELNVISHNGGMADFDLSTVPFGDYTASVAVDQEGYKSNTVTFHLVVNDKKVSFLTADSFADDGLTISVGNHVLLNATLVYFDEPISNATIVFLLNDTEYTNVTDAQGKATFDLSGIPVGKYLVNYRFDGNEQYKGDTLTANDKLTVSKIATEITVNSTALDLKVDDEVDSGATLTPADAGALNYTSCNSTVAVVVDGKIKALAAGETTITVSFAGNENYTAAEDQNITVTVSLNDASVSAENMALKVGENGTISYTTVPAGLNVSFVPDDSGVVNVTADGTVTALKNGTAQISTAQITINVGDNEKYAMNSTVITVTVTLIDASVTAEDMTLKVGENGTISYTTVPAGLNVSFVVDDSGVVEVDANGTVTALKKGTAQVTVLVGDGKKYALNSTVINVTVNLKDASVIAEDMELTVGETGVVNYTTTPPGLNVTFVYYDSGIISVDKNGTVTALKAGTTKVIVVVGDDKIYNLNLTEINVTVNLKDANWTYIDVHTGNESELDGAKFLRQWIHSPITCFVKDANGTGLPAGTNITIFCQGDENYTINTVAQEDGKFTVNVSDIALGEYKVTFHADDYTDATAKITIIKALTEINVKNETVSLKAGEEVGSGATLTPADAGNLTYTSSNCILLLMKIRLLKLLLLGMMQNGLILLGVKNMSLMVIYYIFHGIILLLPVL
ncbi:Ig-like domain-containing protein [uncultured Methanobrevibacter sp.]|uniref:Ig-like domain-containing protein n=1 Tax=uncultured Methanobrevibacter sp. TaxID=253161 RepID=UPI0025E08C93|nr:Ig-like domain-containing protein [uncultured Methanobrevibacter sp.]